MASACRCSTISWTANRPFLLSPPERGLFLEETWRMHPEVCGFISELAYEGRLRSEARCAQQRIDSSGLTGTGLRYLPVDHTGNAQ